MSHVSPVRVFLHVNDKSSYDLIISESNQIRVWNYLVECIDSFPSRHVGRFRMAYVDRRFLFLGIRIRVESFMRWRVLDRESESFITSFDRQTFDVRTLHDRLASGWFSFGLDSTAKVCRVCTVKRNESQAD